MRDHSLPRRWCHRPVDDQRERAVAGRGGDAHVELAVGGVALGEILRVLAHAHDRLAQLRDVRLLAVRAASAAISPSIRRRAASSSNGLGPSSSRPDDLRGARARDEDARADAHLDASRDLERDDRFAHRRARHAEQRGELALGGQARAGGKFAVVDERRDLAGDLPVEPQRLDRVQGHGNSFLLGAASRLLRGRVARAAHSSARRRSGQVVQPLGHSQRSAT